MKLFSYNIKGEKVKFSMKNRVFENKKGEYFEGHNVEVGLIHKPVHTIQVYTKKWLDTIEDVVLDKHETQDYLNEDHLDSIGRDKYNFYWINEKMCGDGLKLIYMKAKFVPYLKSTCIQIGLYIPLILCTIPFVIADCINQLKSKLFNKKVDITKPKRTLQKL